MWLHGVVAPSTIPDRSHWGPAVLPGDGAVWSRSLRSVRMGSAPSRTTDAALLARPWRASPWTRAGRMVRRRTVAHLLRDPFFLYTAALAPIALGGRRRSRTSPSTFPPSLVISPIFIGLQLILGFIPVRSRPMSPGGWSLLRLVVSLLYVAALAELVGGPTHPLLSPVHPGRGRGRRGRHEPGDRDRRGRGPDLPRSRARPPRNPSRDRTSRTHPRRRHHPGGGRHAPAGDRRRGREREACARRWSPSGADPVRSPGWRPSASSSSPAARSTRCSTGALGVLVDQFHYSLRLDLPRRRRSADARGAARLRATRASRSTAPRAWSGE